MLLTQALQAIFFASHPQQRSISKIKQMLVTLNCLLSNHALIKVFIYIIFYAACIFFIILYFCHQKRFYCHLSFISILLFLRVLHHGFNCCMNAKMQMNGNCLSTSLNKRRLRFTESKAKQFKFRRKWMFFRRMHRM